MTPQHYIKRIIRAQDASARHNDAIAAHLRHGASNGKGTSACAGQYIQAGGRCPRCGYSPKGAA